MKKILLLALFTCYLTLNVNAQRNCASMESLEEILQEDPKLQLKMDQIEKATREFLKKDANSRMPGLITIPIVVHVVYNGNTENISAAQINSQIQILNEDFRRLNSDADGVWAQGADSEIEFCLASVDPNGNATDGITRTPTTQTSFAFAGNGVKFSSSGGKDAWPAADYLNVWVCDLEGGLLGYAQFPGGPPATDGVVNDYLYFGDIGTASPPFDLGRTMTHEVGHYLNLRHIWGDGGCGVDDFVADTPESDAFNVGCSLGHVSCGTVDMVQNYMDYSDDACMNLFTEGQKVRMRAIFETGGSRESLLTSAACGTPAEPTCTDGIQNGDEEGIDCGGANCPDCPPEPSCTDGIQNGNETGVDCGGPDCAPCPCAGTNVNVSITFDNYPEETSWTITDAGGSSVASGGTYGSEPDGSTISIDVCLADGCYDFNIIDAFGDGICCEFGIGSYSVTADGVSVASGSSFGASESTNFCLGGGTSPTCTDGIQNGNETGVDCGGPDCDPCVDPPTCSDGIQNGDEEGIDCGGSNCEPCVTPPTCSDGIQNGNETGVDCGGPDCAPCDTGNCTETDVDFEDFEGGFGIWNDGGSDCSRPNSSFYANSGSRTVRLRDNSSSSVVSTDDLGLAGFEEVVIDFSYMGRSMENGEDFWLQGSTDGGSTYTTLIAWASGSDFSNNVREFETVTITGTFTNTTRFRFRCDASSNSDQVYIDDISISGCAGNNTRESTIETDAIELTGNELQDISVYPNPTRDLLNIKFSSTSDAKVQIAVLDMAGKRIIQQTSSSVKGANNVKLNVRDLRAGIYYIHLNNGDQQEIKKFVVIK